MVGKSRNPSISSVTSSVHPSANQSDAALYSTQCCSTGFAETASVDICALRAGFAVLGAVPLEVHIVRLIYQLSTTVVDIDMEELVFVDAVERELAVAVARARGKGGGIPGGENIHRNLERIYRGAVQHIIAGQRDGHGVETYAVLKYMTHFAARGRGTVLELKRYFN